jgi:hypothetical protein
MEEKIGGGLSRRQKNRNSEGQPSHEWHFIPEVWQESSIEGTVRTGKPEQKKEITEETVNHELGLAVTLVEADGERSRKRNIFGDRQEEWTKPTKISIHQKIIKYISRKICGGEGGW